LLFILSLINNIDRLQILKMYIFRTSKRKTISEKTSSCSYNLFQSQKSPNTAFYLENTTDVSNFCCWCLQVSEKVRLWKKTVDSRFGHSLSCFSYSHFIISIKRCDMGDTTFLYIIIILCYVIKLNNSMSDFGGMLVQPKKWNSRDFFVSANIIQ
jgi:hypothetical protein